MSVVLGVSCHYHDAAAALVVDGRIVAAMQQERFSRVKHDPSLPIDAAKACLAVAGLSPGDVDRVAYYEDPYAKLERVLVSLLRTFPRSFRQFPRAVAAQVGDRMWVKDQLARRLGVPRDRVVHREHHRSHAASAFLASPYASAAVLTVDGVGEDVTTAIWHGTADGIRPLATLGFPHSLGLFYAALTAWLGFEVNEGEYKVMGLAAFGRPTRRDELSRVLRLAGDGSFELDASFLADLADPDLGFGPELERLIGPRRPIRKPWDLATADDRAYADVAASLQSLTEDALMGLAREARRRTGEDALCLAGGVALNAVANARVAKEAGFSRVFVQPAAGDAGGALGAALDVARELGDARTSLTTCALGTSPDVGVARAVAAGLGLRTSTVEPVDEIARRVAAGEVVALVDGRFEWGPRALGQRSLLAEPTRPATRDRLNALVKRREPFRPFAPVVPADACDAWFEGGPDDLTPYMTTVRRVRGDGLGAVTHVDGTARVQTVTEGLLHDVAAAMGERTGVPVVLNTSLNGAGEPIVATERDALAFFAAHPIDAMLIGDLLVTRP